ncbi:hypothetical protein M5K25_015063 [Dendrobium thyrsiflorum]|uniref:Uncharacterized protein n=1 Tax=Dendrobium thyrsiflorum TaxID=117978 RepID=A0ABD0UQ03_DENTH
MGDRLRGHEKPAYKAENNPSADQSVLDRLNQIDLRLRQLEKKERLPDSCFAEERGRRYQLPSDMVDVHLKEALMDRLNLLETRIRQVPEIDRLVNGKYWHHERLIKEKLFCAITGYRETN